MSLKLNYYSLTLFLLLKTSQCFHQTTVAFLDITIQMDPNNIQTLTNYYYFMVDNLDKMNQIYTSVQDRVKADPVLLKMPDLGKVSEPDFFW